MVSVCDEFLPSSPVLLPLSSSLSLIENASNIYINLQSLIRQTLICAVQKRLMGNRQFGFMLSGGLDSSLIAAIASRFLIEQRPIAFSVGFEDSPDIENARAVAKHLDIEHRILIITPEECIKIVPGIELQSVNNV